MKFLVLIWSLTILWTTVAVADDYPSPFCDPSVVAGTTTNLGYCRPAEKLCDWHDCNLSWVDAVDALLSTMGSGDIEGPSSWTDNAIVRADGTDGTKVQGSGCTIDDAGSLGCQQHPTLGGALTLYEGADDGTNYWQLLVPATGLTASKVCQLESNATIPADCFTGLTGYYDIRSYGALCDGSTDDATAIQAAENAADDSCGIVLIPYGTCVTGSSIVVSDCVTVAGLGSGSIIKSKSDLGNVAVFQSEADPANDNARDTDITFRDFTIDNSANATGSTGNMCITLRSVVDARVVDVTCIEPEGDCVYIGPGTTKTVFASRNTVSGLHCITAGRHGIAVSGGKRLNITDNQIYAPGSHGIDLELETTATLAIEDVVVADNIIEDTGGLTYSCGVAVTADTSGQVIRNVSITGNTINNTGRGICFRHTTSLVVANNVIYSAREDAIHTNTAGDSPVATTISGNTIKDAAGHGIMWSYAEPVSITGNHIYNTTYHGMRIDNSVGPSITGNAIDTTGASNDCIILRDTTDAVVTGNSLVDCARYGVNVSGSSANTGSVVAGNAIDAATTCIHEASGVGVDSSSFLSNSLTTCTTATTITGANTVSMNAFGGDLVLAAGLLRLTEDLRLDSEFAVGTAPVAGQEATVSSSGQTHVVIDSTSGTAESRINLTRDGSTHMAVFNAQEGVGTTIGGVEAGMPLYIQTAGSSSAICDGTSRTCLFVYGVGGDARTSPPETCDTDAKGLIYTDSDLSLPCFCNGTNWVQMDDFSTVCS